MNWHLKEPFWNSRMAYKESLLFIQQNPGDLPTANLLFLPDREITMTRATGVVAFQDGIDYELVPQTRQLIALPGSNIPFLSRSEFTRKPGQEFSIAHRRGSPQEHLYFSEGHHFHELQVEVTYAHRSMWQDAVPAQPTDGLPRAFAKLLAGDPLRMYLSGDSISAGNNASGITGIAPFMPGFGELAASELNTRWGSAIDFHNLSVGGVDSGHALLVAGDIAAAHPDVVVLAYGMNDIALRNPTRYRENIATALGIIQENNPNVEIVLVAPMLGNPDWEFTPQEIFPLHRDALKTLCAGSVVLMDMTGLWTDLLQYKSYYDLTGNGVNHPNDFGHRIYAEALLSLFKNTGQ
jgi:acyl-CoA thioesterase I